MANNGRGASGHWRSSTEWTFDEASWSAWWWVPLGIAVLSVMGWGVSGLVEGGCTVGPRGGCVAAEGYRWHGWAVAVMATPAFVVAVMGFVADRWSPVVGLVAGAALAGSYVLARTSGTGSSVAAGVFFLIALAAPIAACARLILRRRGAAR